MKIFMSDLDNTLIYSYKHEIGEEKTCVEIYQDREVSYMTNRSCDLLKAVTEEILFVPTTTRTIEQYERIHLDVGIPKYALVCNGGVLLVDGGEDSQWYQESLQMVGDCQEELEKAWNCLEKDENRSMELRNIKELFLFTKSEKPCQSAERLKEILNLSLVEVFQNGVKVYVVPRKLSKGTAVRRLKERLDAELVIAAGDSEFDLPMLQEADLAIAPKGLTDKYKIREDIVGVGRTDIFSDQMLEDILKFLKKGLQSRQIQ